MRKLFQRKGKANPSGRDSFLERDTYWDEAEDWDSAEEEELELIEEPEDDGEADGMPGSPEVVYEALDGDADGIYEPEDRADFYEDRGEEEPFAESGQEETDFDEPEETEAYPDAEEAEWGYGKEELEEAEGWAGDYGEAEDEYDEPGYYEEETDYAEAAWPDDLDVDGYSGDERRRSAGARQAEAAKRNPKPNRKQKKGALGTIGSKIRSMETLDRVMVVTGVAVLVLAIVMGSVFIRINTTNRQISGFAEVGKQLEGISMIGESGLLAVANVQMARFSMAAPTTVPEEDSRKEYDEIGYARDVSVVPNFTSIQKDLKIKFINRNTDKLVANVPFSVTVTDPDGKTSIWSDDDMDGIIHKKDITPGTYLVAMESLTDEKYAGYKLFTDSQSVEVKKEIVYEKVNVANEVKKESEVNAAKEDTRKNETKVESTLSDTVAWVESKVISATYNEVAKSTIPDPVTLSFAAVQRALFLSMEESGTLPLAEEVEPIPDPPAQEPSAEQPSDPEPPISEDPVTPPETENPEPPVTGDPVIPPETENPDPSVTGDPAMPPVTGDPMTPPPTGEDPAVPTQDPNVPPLTASPDVPDGTLSPEDPPVSQMPDVPPVTSVPNPQPTVATLTKGTLSVTPAQLNAIPGTSLAAKATAAGFTEGKKLVYAIASSNPGIAAPAIDANGNITISALADGTAGITVAVNYENGAAETSAYAVINVNVTSSNALTLDKNALNVYAVVPVVINARLSNAAAAVPVLTAESSDTGVATVSVDKTAITVTGVAEGTAVVTVKCMLGNQEVSAACTVTVRKHPREDNVTLLKDENGQQLYVLEGNEYREATRADYYVAEKFFIKGDAKYSGWQTLEGKVYYFKADGTKVTGEQVIQGAKYNFASDGSLVTGSNGSMGIDVSKWNGKIDWNAVKNSGVSYAIIRCGYRGSALGSLIEDPRFEENIQGATAAGLKVGVYFFTQALDEMEAVEEASMVLDQIRNYRISYPVFLDVEASGGRADGLDKATRTAVCKAFCQTIQNGGYTAGIYANKTWLDSKIDAGSLSAYKIWLAQYAASPSYKGRYDLWQYRSTGSISGISGNVDFNISYLGY